MNWIAECNDNLINLSGYLTVYVLIQTNILYSRYHKNKTHKYPDKEVKEVDPIWTNALKIESKRSKHCLKGTKIHIENEWNYEIHIHDSRVVLKPPKRSGANFPFAPD